MLFVFNLLIFLFVCLFFVCLSSSVPFTCVLLGNYFPVTGISEMESRDVKFPRAFSFVLCWF